MKKLKWIATLLVMVCVLLGVIGCKDPEIEDTPTKKYGTVKGKAYYSNENVEDHSGIQITLVSTDGLRSVAYCESRGIATNSRSVSDIKTTAKDGSYSFENIPVGTYTIWASSRNSVEEAIETNVNVKANEVVTANDLNLVATGNVKGTITIDGKTDETLGLDVFIAGTSYVAKVGPTGNYEISKVPASKGYMLCVQKGEYTTIINEDLEVKAKETIEVGSKNLLSKDWATDNETQTNPTFKWLGEFATEPENPDLYDAYYNTTDGCSYIWNGSDWDLLAKSGEDGADGEDGVDGEDGKDGADGAAGDDGQSIVWKGALEAAPENPDLYDAYYNTTDGCSYIWNGGSWDLLAKDGEDGADGEDGKDGADGAVGADGQSIVWKGELEAAPENPELNWAYYNINTGCSYIWNGNSWDLLTQHAHTYEWTSDEKSHWYACACGAKKDFEEHTYGTWNVTTEPTTNTEGRNERTCSNCGYVDSVVLQPVPEGFRFVKGGTITGAAYENNYEGVFSEGRTVTLSDFYMGKYEVTQEEYASVMEGQTVTVDGTEYALESNPNYCTEDSTSYTLFSGDEQGKRPVDGVTWYDAVWYCNALSEKEGLTKAYNIEVKEMNGSNNITAANVTLNENANGYRLPTEAEWEYAARGGDPTAEDWNYVFSGADTAEGVAYNESKNSGLDSVGWYCYNNITGITGDTDVTNNVSGKGSHQVGKKAANRLGLYDMSGNVCEWCYDWYGTVNTGEESDPTGASSGGYRVRRGGSWGYRSGGCAVARRDDYNPDLRYYYLGFRVVRPSTDEDPEIHVHTFAEAWTYDASGHWHAATCEHTEEISGFAEHTYGEYVSNNDATTEADGTKTRECSVCGYEDTVTDEDSKIIVPEGFVLIEGATVTGAAYTNNYTGVFIEGRTVTLSDFYMGKYEVTQEKYASVMAGQKVTVDGTEYTLESNPNYCTEDSTSYTLFSGDEQGKRPVEGVTWYDAVWYCNALSEKEGLTKAYDIEVTRVSQPSGKTGYSIRNANVTLNKNANGYRLPTKAEWEYAARGGDPTKDDWNYAFSGAPTAEGVAYDSSKNSGLDTVGWYRYNNKTGSTTENEQITEVAGKGTHQVGKKSPNRLGLYDMSGNVGEWCYEYYYKIIEGDVTDPTGDGEEGDDGHRACCGGSWYNEAKVLSVRGSVYNPKNRREDHLGFRIVRSAN